MLDTRKRNASPNDLRDMDPTDLMKMGQAMYRKDILPRMTDADAPMATMTMPMGILPRMTDADKGMFVVMDIASGDYEMDIRSADADGRLSRRRPDAVLHIERVGSPAPFAAVSVRLKRPPQR